MLMSCSEYPHLQDAVDDHQPVDDALGRYPGTLKRMFRMLDTYMDAHVLGTDGIVKKNGLDGRFMSRVAKRANVIGTEHDAASMYFKAL